MGLGCCLGNFWVLELCEEIPHRLGCPSAFAVVVGLSVSRGCDVSAIECNVTDGVPFGTVLEVINDMGFAACMCLVDGIRISRDGASIIFGVEHGRINATELFVLVSDEGASSVAHAGDSQVGDFLFAIGRVRNPGRICIADVVHGGKRCYSADFVLVRERERIAHHGSKAESRCKNATFVNAKVCLGVIQEVAKQLMVCTIAAQIPSGPVH